MSRLEVSDLKRGTEAKLRASQHAGGEAIDVEFFEFLIKRLAVFEAKAHLREFHIELLQKRKQQLEGV